MVTDNIMHIFNDLKKMFLENCLGGSSFSSANQGGIRLSCVLCVLVLRHLQLLTKLLAECEAASGLVFETEVLGEPQRRREGWTGLQPGFSCYGHRLPLAACIGRPFGLRVGWIQHRNVTVDPWPCMRMSVLKSTTLRHCT